MVNRFFENVLFLVPHVTEFAQLVYYTEQVTSVH